MNQDLCLNCNKQLSESQIKMKRVCCSPKCYTEYNKTIQKPCKECQIPFTPKKNQNKDFCSNKCKHLYLSKQKALKEQEKAKDTRSKGEKARDTYKAKTGYDNPSQNPEVKRKKEETSIKNHGVSNPMKSKKVKETLKQSMMNKYGVESSLQLPETREKIKETLFKKYGVINPAYSDEIIEKGLQTRIENKLSNYQDFNIEFIKENFIKNDFFLIHDFMDYFSIKSIITANKYKKKFNIIEPNKIKYCITQQELFSQIPTENKILNDRSLLNPKEIDILIPDKKIAIEYDGLMYHSIGSSEYFGNVDKRYHLTKTELCEEKGYQLLHIFESDDIEIWKSIINNKLGLNKKIFARKCKIKEVSHNESTVFLNKNHLQGECPAKYRYGLFYDNELVSLMTFGKSRYNKNYDYELIRFCSKKGYNIVGGASKLLTHFRKEHPGSIISYANRRWSNGNLYRKLGFTEIGVTNSNYFYFKEGKTELYSRVSFQKYKLKDILNDFNPELTEEQNMFNNKYRKIYDCGNFVFALE